MAEGFTPSVWFPVVSVVLGFICKGVLDHFSEQRRIEADRTSRREGRSEAARLRRIEFQRSSLIELQELLDSLGRYAARCHIEDVSAYRKTGTWGRNMLEGSLSEDMRQAQSRAVLLESRIESDHIREAVAKFRNNVGLISLADTETQSDETLQSLAGLAKNLHDQIGLELRRLDGNEDHILS